MKKFLCLLAIATLFISGCQYFQQKTSRPLSTGKLSQSAISVTVGDETPELPAIESPDQATTTNIKDSTDSTLSQYSIYLIALDDKGLNGKEVGCGDSSVAVTQTSQKSNATSNDLLKEAFDNLLALKTKDYGESGFNNFLADSKLKLVSTEIKDGKASVKLSGQLSLAGECDDPRVKAQLQETAAQFDDVNSVEIFLNGKTLEQATNLKE